MTPNWSKKLEQSKSVHVMDFPYEGKTRYVLHFEKRRDFTAGVDKQCPANNSKRLVICELNDC